MPLLTRQRGKSTRVKGLFQQPARGARPPNASSTSGQQGPFASSPPPTVVPREGSVENSARLRKSANLPPCRRFEEVNAEDSCRGDARPGPAGCLGGGPELI